MSENPLLLPPSLTSVPGVSHGLLASLFQAAAEFYALAPWLALGSETNLAIHYPGAAEARLVVVMGSGGQAYGLSVYDCLDDLRRMYQLNDPLAAANELCWLALTYETAEYLSRADLRAVERFGWQVANPSAYPAIVRIGSPGPELHPPLLTDLVWLEGALRILTQFLRQRPQLDEAGKLRPVDLFLKSQTCAGLAEARLRLPGIRV